MKFSRILAEEQEDSPPGPEGGKRSRWKSLVLVAMGAGVLLLAVVLGATYLPQGGPPAGYKLYSNPSPAWTIYYPDSWQYTFGGNTTSGRVMFYNSTTGSAVVNVDWFAGENVSRVARTFRTLATSPGSGFVLVSSANVTLSGLPAVEFVLTSQAGGTTHDDVVTIASNSQYLFVIYQDSVASYPEGGSMASTTAGTFSVGS